jgi:tetratricopeptide (TPR) repeat protein
MIDSRVTERALSDGEYFYLAGRHEEALREFERATQLDPNCTAAFVKCGNAFFALNNFEDARRSYLKAVSLDLHNADAHYRLGRTLYKLKDAEGAAKEFEAAAAIDAAFVDAHYWLGEAFYTLGKYQEAGLKYERVISLEGAPAEAPRGEAYYRALRGKAYHSWGQTLVLRKKYEEALAKYRSAYESGLRDRQLFHNWGVALHALGRTAEAVEKYKEAVARDRKGDMYATHNNLGRIYDALYQDEDALREFELATSAGSSHAAVAYNNWGNVLLRLRRYNEALEQYLKSIEHDPDYAKAYYNKAYMLWQQGKHKEARRAWKEALGVFVRKKEDAKDTEHFRLCGNIFHEVFQEEALAEKAYLKALVLAGENVEAMVNLITLYLGQRDEARDAVEMNEAQTKADAHFRNARCVLKRRLQETLEKKGDDSDLRILEGNLYQAVGKHAEAERAYLKALETLKGSGRVMELQATYVGLGNSYIQQEDYKKGAEYLELAIEENADDLLVKSHLAEAYRKLGRTDRAEHKYEEIFVISASHVESYIGRGELCKMIGDAGDVDMYDYAITFFTDALALSKSGDASKILKDRELAALLYSRGYASVKLYEYTKPAKDESLLRAALSDFKISYQKDKCNIKAKRACEKLSLRLSYTRSQQALRSVVPPAIFAISLILFLITQYLFFTGKAVFWDESAKGLRSMGEGYHALLTFGSLVFMIAGLSLPQLLKIKIAGVELEKSTIEQAQSWSNLGISK